MGMTTVFVVVNGVILAAYTREHVAWAHARTVTGATVQPLYVLDQLAATAVDDLAVGGELDDEEEETTPVNVPISDITKTQPGTPRAKIRDRSRAPTKKHRR